MIRDPSAASALIEAEPAVADALRRMLARDRPLMRVNKRDPWRVEFQGVEDQWRIPLELVAQMIETGLLSVTNAYDDFENADRTWSKVPWRARLSREGAVLAARLPKSRLQERDANDR